MTAAPTPSATEAGSTAASHEATLNDVVARLAIEVTGPLTLALERVTELSHNGKIDRQGLQALRDEISAARTAGLRAQQIARFIRGLAHPTVERVSLTDVMGAVIAEHAAETGPNGPSQRQLLAELQVMGDATLIHRLLRAAADWAGSMTRSGLDWTLDFKPGPARARVICRFNHRPPAASPTPAVPQPIPAEELTDTLDWQLLQYTARAAGVTVRREFGAALCVLTVEFPHPLNDGQAQQATPELPTINTATLAAGGQVLVLAARREARQLVRDALRGHDLFIDYVSTVSAAQDYCSDGLPQVLIYEANFAGDALQKLLNSLAQSGQPVALVEVAAEGQDFVMGPQGARIGADGLRHTLPAVLVMELARRR